MLEVLKLFVRLGLWFFVPKLIRKHADFLRTKGPLLIVANHPNSFLDAIIIGAFYPRKLHFLARGDIFRKPIFGYLLRSIGMIPIHRAREGREHLHENSATFREAVGILKQGGAVLIFIEGICLNTHALQPFKKGMTRILEEAQRAAVYPMIQLHGLAYSDFRLFGKTVRWDMMNFERDVDIVSSKNRLQLNSQLFSSLQSLIVIPVHEPRRSRGLFYWLNWPYYLIIQTWIDKKTAGTVFYDSVLFAVLLFTYPLYVSVGCCLLWIFLLN